MASASLTMRFPHSHRMLWLGLVLAACDRLPTEHRLPPPQSFSASPDVWSGAELTITSQGLAAESLPVVLLDDQFLGVRRVDDTTVVASAPDRPGPHALRVVASGVDQRPVVVQLRGFVDRVEGPLLSGRTEPGRDVRYLFGSGPTGLRRWNIRTNKAIDLGDTVHAVSCTRAWGRDPRSGISCSRATAATADGGLYGIPSRLYPMTDTRPR